MADERLRQLERRWKETGSPEDETRYLQEGVRAGEFIETGFIERDRRINAQHSPDIRVLLPEGIQEFSLVSIAGNHVVDIEYCSDRIHLLAQSEHCAYTAVLHSIDVNGGVSSQMLRDVRNIQKWIVARRVVRVHSLQRVDDELTCEGIIFSDTRDLFWTQSSRGTECAGPHIDCTPALGFLYGLPTGFGVGRYRLHSEREGPLTPAYEDSVDVYVQDGIAHAVSRTRVEDGLVHCGNHTIPSSSRLARRQFIAKSTDDLARYHALKDSGDFGYYKRTILEVPRKNIDGLLNAIERRSQ